VKPKPAKSIENQRLLHADGDELARQGRRLGFLIHDVSRMRRAAYDQLMKPLNVTRARWWVLAYLSRNDGMMQSQLADVLDVGKASLGTVLEQLELGGWVERRSDPTDKRARRVYLSKTAQPFIKRMTQEDDDFNDRILADLNLEDRMRLIDLLSRIKQSLSKMGSQSAPSGNSLDDD
jgi:DNA-binding MarR family transcriptional regulator